MKHFKKQMEPQERTSDEAAAPKEQSSVLKKTITKKPRPPVVKGAIRKGHEWTVGYPGTYTDEDLARCEGRYLACPGCTVDDFELGNCHTLPIINEFKRKFPDRCPPTFISLSTTVVEGKGGLRDVLLEKDTIYAGVGGGARGAPTVRELGVSLPRSIFGNPQKLEDRKEAKKLREEKKAEKAAKKAAKELEAATH